MRSDVRHQFFIEQIALVKRNNLRLFFQSRAIGFQLFAHGVPGLDRIIAGRVDQMDQYPTAFDMAQKAITDACPFSGPCDQSRYIGDDKFAAFVADHAQLRAQSGKGIGADLSHSFVMRGGKRLKVDFVKLFQQGDLSQNVPLEPDDYIYFPSSSANQIFVVGAVGGQGVVPYSQNATLISAITARGGFMDKAYQSRVLVVRGSLNTPETFIVDAKAILAGEKPDFRLEPKDIVYVSRRPWARAEEILDSATVSFIQAALVTWTGQHVGPFITSPIVDP